MYLIIIAACQFATSFVLGGDVLCILKLFRHPLKLCIEKDLLSFHE